MSAEQVRVEVPSSRNYASKNRKGYEFVGNLADAVFSKTLMPATLPYGWSVDDLQSKYDIYNKYTLNSYNHRGPEFSSNVDFIFAGCSQTLGIGVPDDGVWPKFVADSLNATYVNLSMLGAGMEWITDSIYRYVHTFGKPNRGIIVFAPDYYRVDALVDNNVNSCSHAATDYVPQYYDESNSDFRLVTCHLDNSDRVSYIKRPFSVNNTIIEAEAIRRSIKAIKDLEIFCEQADIPLIWSTWSEDLDELIRNMPDQYKFDNYISTTSNNWRLDSSDATKLADNPEGIAEHIVDESGVEIDCHSNFAEYYGLAFHRGTDRFKFKNGEQYHLGVHRHMHIAADFSKRVMKLGV